MVGSWSAGWGVHGRIDLDSLGPFLGTEATLISYCPEKWENEQARNSRDAPSGDV